VTCGLQQGIASKLLRLVLDDLPARGYDTAKLHVASLNVTAQSLYLKMGFVQTDYKENYYQEEEDCDAVVMQLQFTHEQQQDICCTFV
jgi:ribosomal protein S18 acetylase RimI-like enzyme